MELINRHNPLHVGNISPKNGNGERSDFAKGWGSAERHAVRKMVERAKAAGWKVRVQREFMRYSSGKVEAFAGVFVWPE